MWDRNDLSQPYAYSSRLSAKEKRHICDYVGCNKAFVQRQHLLRHQTMKHGRKCQPRRPFLPSELTMGDQQQASLPLLHGTIQAEQKSVSWNVGEGEQNNFLSGKTKMDSEKPDLPPDPSDTSAIAFPSVAGALVEPSAQGPGQQSSSSFSNLPALATSNPFNPAQERLQLDAVEGHSEAVPGGLDQGMTQQSSLHHSHASTMNLSASDTSGVSCYVFQRKFL